MDIKEVATVITQYFNEVPLRTNSPVSSALECLEKISLTDKLVGLYICGCPDGLNRLKEFVNQSKRKAGEANDPEPESKTGSLKQVMADIEAKNGKLTREQAMIAYCSGKEIEVFNGHDVVVASVVGQMPSIDREKGGIPLFCNAELSFRIAPKHPKLVDGLEACKAYREGKNVVRNNLVYQKGIAMHPDFALDGWKIID